MPKKKTDQVDSQETIMSPAELSVSAAACNTISNYYFTQLQSIPVNPPFNQPQYVTINGFQQQFGTALNIPTATSALLTITFNIVFSSNPGIDKYITLTLATAQNSTSTIGGADNSTFSFAFPENLPLCSTPFKLSLSTIIGPGNLTGILIGPLKAGGFANAITSSNLIEWSLIYPCSN